MDKSERTLCQIIRGIHNGENVGDTERKTELKSEDLTVVDSRHVGITISPDGNFSLETGNISV